MKILLAPTLPLETQSYNKKWHELKKVLRIYTAKELFLLEDDFQNSSTKIHPDFRGLETNQRHEIETFVQALLYVPFCTFECL